MAASKLVFAAVVTAALSAIPPQAGERDQRAVLAAQPGPAAPGAPPQPPVVIQQMGPPLQPGMFNWATAIASVFASLAAIATVAGPIIKMLLENRAKTLENERRIEFLSGGLSRALNESNNQKQTNVASAAASLMDQGYFKDKEPPIPPRPTEGGPA